MLHVDEEEIKTGLGEKKGNPRGPDFRNHGPEDDFALFQSLLHSILENHVPSLQTLAFAHSTGEGPVSRQLKSLLSPLYKGEGLGRISPFHKGE
jgi:hypothetical protein